MPSFRLSTWIMVLLLGIGFGLGWWFSPWPRTVEPVDAATAIAEQTPTPPATTLPVPNGFIRVATWNIEWLGRPDKRNGVAQKAEDIAEYLKRSHADAVCLNEISHDTPGDGPWANQTLTAALQLLQEQTGHQWKQILFRKEDPNEKDQLLGVIWNTARLKLIGEPFRIPVRRVGKGEFLRRHPWAVKFSAGEGKTDFVLIPIHLKSNLGGREVTAKQRGEEAKAIVRALATVQNQFTDDDVLILGDSNCLSKDEVALTRFVFGGFRDLNGTDTATWIKSDMYDYAPFDRILVPEDQPEFQTSLLRVHKDHGFAGGEEEYRKRLSDHYMVIADLRVMDDDD